MGDLISLSERRRAAVDAQHRPQERAARSTFYFDLALPATYLAAERVDRCFAGVRWQPVLAETVWGSPLLDDPEFCERLMRRAEARAEQIRAPFVWPERFPVDTRAISRAAMAACEQGRGAAFALAAGRLAFCGGFDLGEPEVLIEAGAAAGMALDDVLSAAADASRDEALAAAGSRLREAGAAD